MDDLQGVQSQFTALVGMKQSVTTFSSQDSNKVALRVEVVLTDDPLHSKMAKYSPLPAGFLDI
jgi:hypothetical protein